MGVFAAIADDWEHQRQKSETILGDWVHNNPNMGTVVAATAISTAMQLGSGLVDTLRLGQGVAQGGWRGYLSDGLRLINVAGFAVGPALKLTRYLHPVTLARNAETAISAKQGVCAWVSGTHAVRMAGVRLFASVDDLLASAGYSKLKFLAQEGNIPKIMTLQDMIPPLKALGARVKDLGAASSGTLGSLQAASLANKNGVIYFALRWKSPASGKTLGHAMVAFRQGGEFKILDRYGAVVENLGQLERLYAGISAARIGEMIFVENAVISQIATGISVVSMEVSAALH
jgi:hypothetical protein